MRLRNLRENDLRFVYKVRNHHSVRAVSGNKDIIDYRDHLNYWNKKIASKQGDCKIIIHKGRRIGYIRRKNGFISLAIAPLWQGKGLGSLALKKYARKGDKVQILPFNKRSLYVFNKVGFKEEVTTLVL